MTLSLPQLWRSERPLQFIKFCCVGGSGVVVDMAILALLADPRLLGLNVALSKVFAAEAAMINNFIWNELWTFRSRSLSPTGGEGASAALTFSSNPQSAIRNPKSGLLRRFLTFNAICGIGIGLAVLLLHLFHTWLGWNLYFSNALAIVLVTIWNFSINARFNWGLVVDGKSNLTTRGEMRVHSKQAWGQLMTACIPIGVLVRTFVRLAAFVLIITGSIKAISSFQAAPGLVRPDPLFTFMSVHDVLLLGGVSELAIATILIWRNNHLQNLILLVSISSIFMAYRMVLWSTGPTSFCACLGNASSWVGIKPDLLEGAANLLFLFLFVGSYYLLFRFGSSFNRHRPISGKP